MAEQPKRPDKRRREVWHPAEYEKSDVSAIQALERYARLAETPPAPGEEVFPPTPEQMLRALNWIIHQAAATYENGFVADDANGRIGAFIEGRRSVGQQIVKLTKLKMGTVFHEERCGENG